MAFDGIVVAALVRELKQHLTDGRIYKIGSCEFSRYSDGRIYRVGSEEIRYYSDGRIYYIG